MKNKKYLFVYGSMKKGLTNHKRVSGADFIGVGKTVDKFMMHPALFYLFPYLIENGDNPHKQQVVGETYSVDNIIIETVIDTLEGVPEYYYRKEIDVELESGKIVAADVYFANIENGENEMDIDFPVAGWGFEDEAKGLRLARFLGRF